MAAIESSSDEADSRIEQAALDYARKHKKRLAKLLTDPDVFPPEEAPVSVFMAGSPGAGKTEASVSLLETLSPADSHLMLRIDPDDLRSEFPGYDGSNSWLFHSAVSILVDRIHDLALKQQQSFLLDGTLASYDIAKRNIERSLKKDRLIQILYVYQDPILAWDFVLAREAQEGRRILRRDFINQYFAARDSVNRLKEAFGKRIHIDLLVKNNDGSQRLYRDNVQEIDSHIPEKYSRTALEESLQAPF